MQVWSKIMFSGMLFLGAAACSSERRVNDEGWYEQSRQHSQKRDQYVDTYIDQGVSELEAKRSWEMQEMIRNTQGSWHSTTARGEEMLDMVAPE